MTTSHHPARSPRLARLAVAVLIGLVLGVLPAAAQARTLTDVHPNRVVLPEAGVPRVLIYSATYGFRHPVIPKGNTLMMSMGLVSGAYEAVWTENPADLSAANLAAYDAVVFHSPAGKPPSLTDQTRAEFIRFMACGGGFVGLAMAADSNYGWAEYTELLGGNIVTHPLTEGHGPATRIEVSAADHQITRTFAERGMDAVMTQEELYTFRMDPRRLPTVTPLLSIDTTSVAPSIQEGPDYFPDGEPVAWTSIFRGRGRSHYNGFGHGDLSWDQSWFREMVFDGIKWALGPSGHPVDRACASGVGEVAPAARPTPVAPDLVGKPCALPPDVGPGRGHYRASLATLTAAGAQRVMPVGLPGYIFAPNLRYLLDLSEVAADRADVRLSLTWTGVADYDLGITLPWGAAGSHVTPGLGGDEIATEEVVLEDVPHCTDFLVAAEHLASLSMIRPDAAPTLTVTVIPAGTG